MKKNKYQRRRLRISGLSGFTALCAVSLLINAGLAPAADDTYPVLANSSSDFLMNQTLPGRILNPAPDASRKGTWTYLASNRPDALNPSAVVLNLNYNGGRFGLSGQPPERYKVSVSRHVMRPAGPGSATPYCVQRWTSGETDAYLVRGMFNHLSAQGDGVRVYVFSGSRQLLSLDLHNNHEKFAFTLPVSAGQSVDFIVGPNGGPDSDETQIEFIIDKSEPRYVGKLKPFWRGSWDTTPVRPIPSYLLDAKLDFPVRKRPYDREIALVDNLTIVRPLSGRNRNNDLAYRDAGGNIRYRWEPLKSRLDPTINVGYTGHLIILDNVPYAFTTNPVTESFGQCSPPQNHDEWYDFIVAFCRELKELYPEVSETFRFRVGTELDVPNRWCGPDATLDHLLKHYDYSVHAVKQVFPNAQVGIFNEGKSQNLNFSNNRKVMALVKHITQEPNLKSGKMENWIDFIPISYYHWRQDNVLAFEDIDHRAVRTDWFYDTLLSVDPVKMSHVTREIHEHGILEHIVIGERGERVEHPGAYGAPLYVHTLINFAGMDIAQSRQWWKSRIDYIDGSQWGLLCSDGWAYTLFDHLRDGEAYIVPVREVSGHGTRYKELISVFPERNEFFLVLSAHNAERTPFPMEKVTAVVPKTVIARHNIDPDPDGWSVKSVTVTPRSFAYDMIYDDLKQNGLLNNAWDRPDKPTSIIRNMGRGGAVNYIKNNWNKYTSAIQNSLTLKDQAVTAEDMGMHIALPLEMTPPQVNVFRIAYKTVSVPPRESRGRAEPAPAPDISFSGSQVSIEFLENKHPVHTCISLLNLRGETVMIPFEGITKDKRIQFQLDPAHMESGVYLLHITSGNEGNTLVRPIYYRKMILQKKIQ